MLEFLLVSIGDRIRVSVRFSFKSMIMFALI